MNTTNPIHLNKGDSLKSAIFVNDSSNSVKISPLEGNGKEKYVIETNSGSNIDIDTSIIWPLNIHQWEFLLSERANALSKEQLYDSLRVESKSSFDQYVIRQIIRVKKTDKEYLYAFVAKNLSFMMFIMLPLFALILKLLYARRKILYIQHLVHTLHIHSFAFFVYSISLAIYLWLVENTIGFKIAVLFVTIYCFISFVNVYKQKLGKTLMKFLLTGFLYSIFLFFAFFIELFLSLMLF